MPPFRGLVNRTEKNMKMYLMARHNLTQKTIVSCRSRGLVVAFFMSVALTSCGNLSLNSPQGSSVDRDESSLAANSSGKIDTGAAWADYKMTEELPDVSRRLTNGIGTCWLHAGLKEMEVAYFKRNKAGLALSIDYAIYTSLKDRYDRLIHGDFVRNADLEAGGELNEARLLAVKYGVIPERSWKPDKIDWRMVADLVNINAANFRKQIKRLKEAGKPIESLEKQANLHFESFMNERDIHPPKKFERGGKTWTPVEFAKTFLNADPDLAILFSTSESSAGVKVKADMPSKQDIFMTDWQSVTAAIVAQIHDKNSLLLSVYWKVKSFEIIGGVLNVIKPIQSQFEGHVLNIVGYNVGPRGELKWVKLENTWGEGEGLNGFYVVDVASFKALFQAMSVLDGAKLVDKKNLPGKMITK